MGRPKGLPKSGGRKAGTPNKMTKDVREAFEEAVAYAQGKHGYSLKDWATRSFEDNAKFWMAALKAMPKQVEHSGSISLEALLARAHEKADSGE